MDYFIQCSACSMTVNPYGLKRILPKPKPWFCKNSRFWVHYTNLKIPDKGGVYFLFSKKGVIIYVGRTANLRSRIACHVRQCEIGTSYIKKGRLHMASWIVCEQPETRCFLEVFYLYHLNPEANMTKYQSKYYSDYAERHEWGLEKEEERKILANLSMSEQADYLRKKKEAWMEYLHMVGRNGAHLSDEKVVKND